MTRHVQLTLGLLVVKLLKQIALLSLANPLIVLSNKKEQQLVVVASFL